MATRRQRREAFGICLGRLSRLWRAEIDRRLSTHGITDAQGQLRPAQGAPALVRGFSPLLGAP